MPDLESQIVGLQTLSARGRANDGGVPTKPSLDSARTFSDVDDKRAWHGWNVNPFSSQVLDLKAFMRRGLEELEGFHQLQFGGAKA